jgi:hypothetical protein
LERARNLIEKFFGASRSALHGILMLEARVFDRMDRIEAKETRRRAKTISRNEGPRIPLRVSSTSKIFGEGESERGRSIAAESKSVEQGSVWFLRGRRER